MWSYSYCSDSFHSVDLIRLVEQHPVLWHPHHSNHNNKQERMNAWDAIAERIVKNWADLGGKGRHHTVAGIKSKWKNIKDTFIKNQKYMSKTVAGKRKKKKYIYADMLDFLNLTTNSENSFLEESAETVDDAPSTQAKVDLEELKEDEVVLDDSSYVSRTDLKGELSSSDCESIAAEPAPQQGKSILFVDSTSTDVDEGYQVDSRSRQSTSSGFVSSSSVGKKRSVDEVSNCRNDDGDGDDPDKMFLLSMLPLFKNLNEQGKISARIQLTQVLQKLLYPKKV